MANKLLPILAVAGAALAMRKKTSKENGPNCCGKCAPIEGAPNYRCVKAGETQNCGNCVYKLMVDDVPVCDIYGDQPVNSACTCDSWEAISEPDAP